MKATRHCATVALLSVSVASAVGVACTTARRADRRGMGPTGWPVPPEVAAVTSSFGTPRGGSRHQGIDLSAPAGTPVRCTAAGTVSSTGRSGAFGRLVVIDHDNGWESRYAHLRSIKVRPGERVRRGQIIGTVGRSGNATGYHLHYELRHYGKPVDPHPRMSR